MRCLPNPSSILVQDHAPTPVPSPLGRHLAPSRLRHGDHLPDPRRARQQPLASNLRRLHVPNRLPFLRRLPSRQSPNSRQHPSHPSRASPRRSRLRTHQQVDRLRPPLRRHRRPRPVSRTHASRAIRLPPRSPLDRNRSRPRRSRPRLRPPLLFPPPRRKIARSNGSRRDRQSRRLHRPDHRSPHHDHSPRGDRPSSSERSKRQPLGSLHPSPRPCPSRFSWASTSAFGDPAKSWNVLP